MSNVSLRYNDRLDIVGAAADSLARPRTADTATHGPTRAYMVDASTPGAQANGDGRRIAQPKYGLSATLRALRHRNFQLFFGGQFISLIGTWMQSIAQDWLVYRLTGSAWLLGVVAFAGQIPVLLLSPVAGIVADRRNRQYTVIATQTASMIIALDSGNSDADQDCEGVGRSSCWRRRSGS